LNCTNIAEVECEGGHINREEQRFNRVDLKTTIDYQVKICGVICQKYHETIVICLEIGLILVHLLDVIIDPIAGGVYLINGDVVGSIKEINITLHTDELKTDRSAIHQRNLNQWVDRNLERVEITKGIDCFSHCHRGQIGVGIEIIV